MSRALDGWREERPEVQSVLAFHDRPNYEGDPGPGLEFRVEGDEVFVSIFWDGDERMVVAFTREEFSAV